ncbi:MAG: PEP-CTERM sorting domain-containing protein [Nanoarchaeota archaeon]|nr:PEP-CTERM sorting domain-containing protein [Nanoarchaeota archaeon]
MITLNSDFNGLDSYHAPDVNLYEVPGVSATDGYDPGLDNLYQQPDSTPAVDFFSIIAGYDLSDDVRDFGYTAFHTKMQGRGLTSSLSGNLTFSVDSPVDFPILPGFILVDIYKNGSLVERNINVLTATPRELSLSNNSDYYNIDVRIIPEPSATSLLMAGIAGAGVGYLASRRKKQVGLFPKNR